MPDVIPDQEFGKGARVSMEPCKTGKYVLDRKTGIFTHDDIGEMLGVTSYNSKGQAISQDDLIAVEPIKRVKKRDGDGEEYVFEGDEGAMLTQAMNEARATSSPGMALTGPCSNLEYFLHFCSTVSYTHC